MMTSKVKIHVLNLQARSREDETYFDWIMRRTLTNSHESRALAHLRISLKMCIWPSKQKATEALPVPSIPNELLI
jgi:hypothetical protein